MAKKLKDILAVIKSNDHETEASKRSDILIKGTVSLLLAGASLVLTAINIFTAKWFMAITTMILFVGFVLTSILLLKFKVRKLTEPIIAFILIVCFTYYAVAGQNDGFAVLWIVLCPPISTLFFTFRRGIVLSAYFFLVVLFVFYGPRIYPDLAQYLPAYKDGFANGVTTPGYYEQFTIRYPALYLSSFVVSIFLNAQKIYYFKLAEAASVSDSMTSLRNRRYFNDYISSIGLQNKVDYDFTILSIDINNLKIINDNDGHDMGDFAITKTAEILHTVFQNVTEHIYRTGGDEFFVFFTDKEKACESYVEQIHKLSSDVEISKDNRLSLSVGSVKGRDYINSNFEELLRIVDMEMYKNKKEYYEQHPELLTRSYLSRRK